MAFAREVPAIPRHSEVHDLETDVLYGTADGTPLRYDLYRTKRATGPAPAVVLVHGGGWMRGDPSQAAGNALHFARLGISTVSISYRLAPAHRFPAPLDDVRRGLRHVRHHAADLGIDPERIALMGFSAGAHLAMLAHVSRGLEGLAPASMPAELAQTSEQVRAVILHYGVYDFAPLGGQAVTVSDADPIGALFGPRRRDPGWVNLASPVHHAPRTTAPVLLIHGTGDTVVPHHQSELMHAALERAGRPSELLLLEGAPHGFQINWRGEANRRANASADALLERVL